MMEILGTGTEQQFVGLGESARSVWSMLFSSCFASSLHCRQCQTEGLFSAVWFKGRLYFSEHQPGFVSFCSSLAQDILLSLE